MLHSQTLKIDAETETSRTFTFTEQVPILGGLAHIPTTQATYQTFYPESLKTVQKLHLPVGEVSFTQTYKSRENGEPGFILDYNVDYCIYAPLYYFVGKSIEEAHTKLTKAQIDYFDNLKDSDSDLEI